MAHLLIPENEQMQEIKDHYCDAIEHREIHGCFWEV